MTKIVRSKVSPNDNDVSYESDLKKQSLRDTTVLSTLFGHTKELTDIYE